MPPAIVKICPDEVFAPFIKVVPPLSVLLTIELTLSVDIFLPNQTVIQVRPITVPVCATETLDNVDPSP